MTKLEEKQHVVGIAPTRNKIQTIFVDKKVPLDQLKKKDRIPRSLGWLWWRRRTDVVEVGEITTQQAVRNLPDTSTYKPLVGGAQISPVGSSHKGTLGIVLSARVVVATDYNKTLFLPTMSQKMTEKLLSMDGIELQQQLIGLTNAHVVDPDTIEERHVTQGRQGVIGTALSFRVHRSKTNYHDMALITLNENVKATPNVIKNVGKVTGYDECQIGDVVEKYGRTSRHTVGHCQHKNVKVKIKFGENDYRWFAGFDMFSHMSLPGDSGSVIVRTKDKKLVSHLFAGSTHATFGIPIATVLAKIGIDDIDWEYEQ